MDKLSLTPQQHAFMDLFGYLHFPGLLADRIARITEEFEAVFVHKGGGHHGQPHDGTRRSVILPFIDQSEYLSSLLDDPRIDGLFSSLLGDDYAYLGSDGNFYVGNTNWHSDTDFSGKHRGLPPRTFYKLAFYLDPVDAHSGALRVIPGSHRFGEGFAMQLERALKDPPTHLGLTGDQVPAVALSSQPGDVVIFNQAVKHSAWGGSNRRRMFTINATRRYQADETQWLLNEIGGFALLGRLGLWRGDAAQRRAGAHAPPGAGPGPRRLPARRGRQSQGDDERAGAGVGGRCGGRGVRGWARLDNPTRNVSTFTKTYITGWLM